MLLFHFRVNTSAVELTTSQLLFSDENRPVEQDYQRTIIDHYNTVEIPVNFYNKTATLAKVNNYIKEVTHGRITKLLSSSDLKEASLILASAIFFKGQWKVPFNISHTTEAMFYDDFGAEAGTVNMMFQRGAFPYTAIADLEAHILELPYGKSNRTSMIIMLPRKGISWFKQKIWK